MTVPLMLATEFTGGIEMEMARVVKPFMFKLRYRWFKDNSRFVKDSLSSLWKETLLSTEKELYVVK